MWKSLLFLQIFLSLAASRAFADGMVTQTSPSPVSEAVRLKKAVERAAARREKAAAYFLRCKEASRNLKQRSTDLSAARLTGASKAKLDQLEAEIKTWSSVDSELVRECNANTPFPNTGSNCLTVCGLVVRDMDEIQKEMIRLSDENKKSQAGSPSSSAMSSVALPGTPPAEGSIPGRAQYEAANSQAISGWRVRGRIYSPLRGQSYESFLQALEVGAESLRPIYGPLPAR
jgi:hypothetical protein